MSISLVGCQTPRTLSDWQGEELSVEAEQPIPKCEWPNLSKEERPDGEYFVMDAVGFGQLLVCKSAERGNYKVAAANAESIEALILRNNAISEIGQRQHDMAEFQMNELEGDKRAAQIEVWTTKGILAAVLIAIAL